MTRARLAGLAVVASLARLALAAEAVPEPEPAGVRIERHERASLIVATLPGTIVRLAFARPAEGAAEIFVLARPEPDAPAQTEPSADDEKPDVRPHLLPACAAPLQLVLYRVRVADPPELTIVASDLPDDVAEVTAGDLGSDGTIDPLLRRPGEIATVREGRLEPLLRAPGLPAHAPPSLAPDSAVLVPVPHAVGATVGRLAVYGPQSGGGWGTLSEVELPIGARLFEGRGLELESPVRQIGRGPRERALYATSPKSFGDRRIRLHVLMLSPSGEASTVESWLHLPEPEQLIEHRFLVLDEQPLLLALTKPADKLSLFGEKRMRLYELAADRSRLGRSPLWQVDSRMNLWQESHAHLVDADGDGRLDLVIGYWKGLGDDKVVLDTYRRLDEGWFDTKPETTTLDVKDADRSWLAFGADPTGDGRADLVLSARGRLAIHPGLAPGKSSLVATRPLDTPWLASGVGGTSYVEVGGQSGVAVWSDVRAAPRVFDLDGDGADELVQIISKPDGADELHVVDLGGAERDPG